MSRFLFAALLVVLAACAKPQVPQDWLGKWTGPEGTYMEISQGQDGLIWVSTQNLDALEISQGQFKGDHIVFIRSQQSESVRKGTGQETGMKWLLDKQNCIVVKTGEGYCRD